MVQKSPLPTWKMFISCSSFVSVVKRSLIGLQPSDLVEGYQAGRGVRSGLGNLGEGRTNLPTKQSKS